MRRLIMIRCLRGLSTSEWPKRKTKTNNRLELSFLLRDGLKDNFVRLFFPGSRSRPINRYGRDSTVGACARNPRHSTASEA